MVSQLSRPSIVRRPYIACQWLVILSSIAKPNRSDSLAIHLNCAGECLGASPRSRSGQPRPSLIGAGQALFDERQSMRNGGRADIGIQHDDDRKDRPKSNRMPDNETEYGPFIADLRGGC